MSNKLRLFALLGVSVLLIGCATMGGAMVGKGIGSMAGNEQAGTMIGAGVGMMADIH